ncbi:hypothetical protein JRF84_08295 [Methylobacterium organophilum]|uniref:hypothetical protein n=1 Tax=Methylobacterium TaxID=407 RepID=UPI0019D1E56D|nr:hypothetical protein [Methylobacterium organophilum]MBN6819589.1 hypothetical protein [Methylobacterium organophilum]
MTLAPDTDRTAEENEAMDRFARLVVEKAEQRIRADFAEANLIALAKMYGEACGDLTYKWVCNNDGWNEAEARAEAAEAEAAHLRAENANLRDRVREAEGAAEAMRGDPGRAAYEARFAHARPRDVEPWDSLPAEVKAIWARVEMAGWRAGRDHMCEAAAMVCDMVAEGADTALHEGEPERAERWQAAKHCAEELAAAIRSLVATPEEQGGGCAA